MESRSYSVCVWHPHFLHAVTWFCCWHPKVRLRSFLGDRRGRRREKKRWWEMSHYGHAGNVSFSSKSKKTQARMWLLQQQVTTTSLLLTRLKLLVTGKWSKPNLVDWCWQKVNLWEEQTGGGEWLLVSEVWLDKNGGGWWWLPTVGWWLRLPSSIWLSTISLAGTLLGHFRKSLRKIKHSTSLTPLFFSCHLFHVTESVGECDFSIGHMVVVVSHRIRLSISIFW